MFNIRLYYMLLSISLSITLYLPIYLYLPRCGVWVHLTCLFTSIILVINPAIFVAIYLAFYLSIYLSIYLSFYILLFYLSVYLEIIDISGYCIVLNHFRKLKMLFLNMCLLKNELGTCKVPFLYFTFRLQIVSFVF